MNQPATWTTTSPEDSSISFEQLNQGGTTVIIASHNEYLLSEYNYPRLVLSNGRLSEKQTSSSFKSHTTFSNWKDLSDKTWDNAITEAKEVEPKIEEKVEEVPQPALPDPVIPQTVAPTLVAQQAPTQPIKPSEATHPVKHKDTLFDSITTARKKPSS